MYKVTSAIGTACLLLGLQLLSADNAHAGESQNCDSQPLTSFWEQDIAGNELSGQGTLCNTPGGTRSRVSVRGLSPGNAYTVWWVYIDDAASCVNFPLTPENSPVPFDEPIGYAGRCGLADFFTEDIDEMGETFLNPIAVFGRLDSVVAGAGRNTRFNDHLRSFNPSSGSQMWVFIVGHGPADESDKRQLARQLLTPEDPSSGVPHVGIADRPFGYPAGVVVFAIP